MNTFLPGTSLIALLLLGAVSLSFADRSHGRNQAQPLATLDYRYLPEASGMAVSGYDPDRLWFINDSGNRAELVAYDLQKDSYRRVRVRKVKNRDWEDLAGFSYRGVPWLAIADVGDNNARRKRVFVHFLPEPDVDESKVAVPVTLTLRFPDGPRDVESIAVDARDGALYLLSKRDAPPVLFRVPLPDLAAGVDVSAVAERLGDVESIPDLAAMAGLRLHRQARYLNQPTAMALLPDRSAIALLTYGSVFLAPLGDDRDWLAALNRPLCVVPTPLMRQAESVTAAVDGSILVASEGREAPLFRLPHNCPRAQ